MPGIFSPRNKLVLPRGYRKPATFVLDQSHPLSRGLVGYWPLGDVPKGTTKDVSKFGKDALIVADSGTPVLTSTVRGGLALNANGGAFHCAASQPPAVTYPLTFVCWAVTSGGVGAGADFVMVCLADNTSLNEFWISLNNTAGVHHFRIVNQQAGSARTFTSTGAPDENNWHQYVGVFYDASNMAIYTDGGLIAGSYGGAASGTPTGINTAFIGGLIYNSSNLYGSFVGAIENVRIYNRALSADEIKRLYTEPFAGLYAANTNLTGAIAPVNYTLTAAFGAFVETGETATLKVGKVLTAAFGAFTETGQAAALKCGRVLTAARGAFVLTGEPALLKLVAKITAAYGAFTLTGFAATLKIVTGLAGLMTGMFTLTGNAAEFLVSKFWTKQDCTDSTWVKADEDCDCE